MPGAIKRAVPKSMYDFGSIPASASGSIVLASGIDVSKYSNLQLVLRIHDINILGSTGPSIELNAYTEAPTPEDPGLEFVTTNPLPVALGTSGAINVGAIGFASPIAYGIQPWVSGYFGGYIRLILTGTQTASKASTFQVWISVDVVVNS